MTLKSYINVVNFDLRLICIGRLHYTLAENHLIIDVLCYKKMPLFSHELGAI